MLKNIILSLSFFCLLLAAPFKSSSESPDIFELDEVVVTATRMEEQILNVPQHVTVITAEQIEQSGAGNLSDVLNIHTGVSTTNYGPEGSLKSVSIRGATAAQILILIDGLKAPGSHGGADLSLIPIDNIERIEIVRGGTSALYGADAVGGVINIITKKKGENRFKIRVENGSYLPQKALEGSGSSEREANPDFLDLLSSQKVNINYTRVFSNVNFNSSGSFLKADNDFIFLDLTNKKRKRENAQIIGGDFFSDLYISLPSGFIDLTGSFLYHDRGIPGQSGSLTPDAEQQDLKLGGTLNYKTDRFFSDYLGLDIKSFYNFFRVDYKDPKWSVDSRHETHSAGADIAQEMLFFDYFSLIYGGSFNFDMMNSTDLGNKERIYAGGFTEIPIYITSRFTLQPVLRYDYYSDFEDSLNFKLGGVYNLSNSKSFKLSISKSFRAPTFNDLYWPKDAFAEGNPDLIPETGYSIDFGLSSLEENTRYDLFGFVRYIKDVILWQPGEDSIWRPSNYGEGIYPGIEVQFDIDFLDYFTFIFNYTFLYTFVLSGDFSLQDNKRLPGIPSHSLDTGIKYNGKKHHFSLNAHYQGLRYLKTENSSYMPSYFIFDLHYKRILTEHLSFLFSADNLFNESYESVSNYPMPGVFIRTGFEIAF